MLVKDLYVFEVRPEDFGREEVHFRFRILPRIGGQARLVRATVRKEFFFRPARLIGDLG